MIYLRLGAIAVLLCVFGLRFDPTQPQWIVDGTWLLAVILWVYEVRRLAGGTLLGVRPARPDVLPIVAALAVFAAAWLPFFDNWRWAYTGDSVGWFGTGWEASRTGMRQNILSARGVDNNFTYLHTVAGSFLMFVVEPTLFWHRAGKLVFSCLSLAAIYTYFTMMLGRWWSLAIVFGTAINCVWLWFSYVSYGHIDSHICYFLTLAIAVLIWREPDRLGRWVLLGLTAGVSVYFTQTAWSAVAAAGVVLGVFALATRRFAALALYAVTGLIVVVPLLLQPADMLHMMTGQTKSIYEWEYMKRIFGVLMWLPYTSPIEGLGVEGAFLRPPLGLLSLVGTGLAAVAVAPHVRRLLRFPPVAPLLVGMLLWDAVLMTLTNNGYGLPSTKRCYNLIPLQVFFAVLPAYLVHEWTAANAWLRRVPGALLALALGFYAVDNIRFIQYPRPALYGTNIFDAFIELRQLHPERRVLFLTTKEEHSETLAPERLFHQCYKLRDQLAIESGFDDATIERACAEHMLICHEPNMDRTRWQPLAVRHAARLRPFQVQNTRELVCFDCRPATDKAPGPGPATP